MKFNRNERGFTLIEMMIVLLIISVLILVAIPNVTKHSKSIDDKGCQAYVKMVQGQVEAYKMENKQIPSSVAELSDADYLPEGASCPDGRELVIDGDGKVEVTGNAGEASGT
ncbi:competence type IV pilus major pilin ComGC [Sporosarcina sp. FSL W7-1349]|uniref:competence type IV pilus major pilin ComGC n=1 Tax=Sporosarcina sp. FSL W7-1349 TaxID=2921561 RepID=UPI0030FB7086